MGKKKNFATKENRKGLTPNPDSPVFQEKEKVKTRIIINGETPEPKVLYTAIFTVRTKKDMTTVKSIYNPLRHDLSINRIVNRCKFDVDKITRIEIEFINKSNTLTLYSDMAEIKKWPIS